MINDSVVRERFLYIDENLSILEEIQNVEPDKFKQDIRIRMFFTASCKALMTSGSSRGTSFSIWISNGADRNVVPIGRRIPLIGRSQLGKLCSLPTADTSRKDHKN